MTAHNNPPAEEQEILSRLGDREWRIDNLYYVRDKDGKKVKFIRNESQEMFWNAMWYMNIILKDRQRGFSTLIAIIILDTCLFKSGTQAGVIDITLADAKKKLGKISFAYECLPEFLQKMFPLKTDSKETIEWKNGSAVYAAISHRGGTLQALHISEMGKIATRFPVRAREIRTGALNTLKAGCFVFNESTAEGNAGEFYEDCVTAREKANQGAKLSKLAYKFHFFAWWMGTENEQDPDGIYIPAEVDKYCDDLEKIIGLKIGKKKRAWYAEKSAQQKDDMKREFPGTADEAFQSSIQGAYLSKQLSVLDKSGRLIEEILLEPAFPVNTGWDFGLNDNMTVWLHQRVEFQDRLIGYLTGTDEDVLYYWAKLNRDFNCVWGYHFLPHDFGYRRGGTASSAASPPKTLEDILIEAGMKNSQIIPRIDDKTAAIAEARSWLPKAFFSKRGCGVGNKGAADGLKCLRNYRREWDENNGCWKDRPRHDWASHGYDAFETLVRGLNAYGSMGAAGERSAQNSSQRHRRPVNWRAV
ncbi:hypothetical protein [Desulfotalea psychrophila]|uniref:hypothetical protein n=1 Tax=Desulfotalea psychrophila TaxID=84980 RepID=UPI000317A904|nr:hypothetical protein [Desulfotalea psychrophila]